MGIRGQRHRPMVLTQRLSASDTSTIREMSAHAILVFVLFSIILDF